MRRTITSLFFAILVGLPLSAQTIVTDICVYGGSAAGVTAAIQAARMGKQTTLVSSSAHVGGLATSGLTATDINRHNIVGGIAAEFYGRIYDYYLQPEVWRNQTREEFMTSTLKRTFSGKNDARHIQWVYESGVGEVIMRQMLAEAGVEVVGNARIALQKGVDKQGRKIRSITLEDGRTIEAKMFIDCSYEGDLMALSGVSNIIGRESKEQYGESLAGVRYGYVAETSPYMNRQSGDLMPYVDATFEEEGRADGRTQAYCYRLTLTDDPNNLVPIECPANYDAALYELCLRKIEANPSVELKNIITFTPMPNRKTDTNHLDFCGASYDYPAANYVVRQSIADAHKNYALGMLWFLGNDPRVPERLRNEMQRWGLAKDEFTDTGNFPYQLYVREARRMIGQFVMTEENVRKDNRVEVAKPIGVGSYMLDCHYVGHFVGSDGFVHGEGSIFASTRPYSIGYDALTPKKRECSNLLVPVCLSASHVAYSSIRMEPTYMVLGQSAAAAAVLAIDARCSVQQVDYRQLEKNLTAVGQILSPANQIITPSK